MKNSVASFLFYLFLTSCVDVCVGADGYTQQGICVFTNGYDIDIADVSYAIYATEAEVNRRYPEKYTQQEMRKNYHDVSIEFVGENDLGDGAYGETETHYGFLVDERYYIKTEINNENICYSVISVIPHEMLHVYLVGTERNTNHPKEWFDSKRFTEEEKNSSIARVIFYNLLCQVCPVGHHYCKGYVE